MPSNRDQNPERDLTLVCLECLARVLDRPLRRGSPAAIRAALGIIRRHRKLRRRVAFKGVTMPPQLGKFPIRIFSEAIKAMEKKDRDENGSS